MQFQRTDAALQTCVLLEFRVVFHAYFVLFPLIESYRPEGFSKTASGTHLSILCHGLASAVGESSATVSRQKRSTAPRRPTWRISLHPVPV